jgi:hypothetical protein
MTSHRRRLPVTTRSRPSPDEHEWSAGNVYTIESDGLAALDDAALGDRLFGTGSSLDCWVLSEWQIVSTPAANSAATLVSCRVTMTARFGDRAILFPRRCIVTRDGP